MSASGKEITIASGAKYRPVLAANCTTMVSDYTIIKDIEMTGDGGSIADAQIARQSIVGMFVGQPYSKWLRWNPLDKTPDPRLLPVQAVIRTPVADARPTPFEEPAETVIKDSVYKLCIDCHYCLITAGRELVETGAKLSLDISYYRCTHPNIGPDVCPVTGRETYERCIDARSHTGLCSSIGMLWEAKS